MLDDTAEQEEWVYVRVVVTDYLETVHEAMAAMRGKLTLATQVR